MRLGIISDTHNQMARIHAAVRVLRDAGAEALIHCGDLTGPPVVTACAVLPLWFVLGNNDADQADVLRQTGFDVGAVCLGWGDVIELGGKRIGVAHGHMTIDVRRIIEQQPDYFLSGHSHIAGDSLEGSVRRINPGALHRAPKFTVAVLDLTSGQLHFMRVSD